MATALSTLFLAALVLTTVLRLWLARRQASHVAASRGDVPVAFRESITLEAHQRAADYTAAKVRLAMIEVVIGALFVLALTLGGVLQSLHTAWSALGFKGLSHGLAFIASLAVLSTLIDLPFSLYRTFVIEERFGFNKMTPRLFLIDLAKGALIGALIGLPVLLAVLWLMERMGPYWWIHVWLFWLGFNLLALLIYPTVIAPLFNKFTPLADAPLRERIESLLARCGFRASGLFVMDGSKRSGHGNAYFTGFGRAKRIVFFDTLLEKLAPEEIEAVLESLRERSADHAAVDRPAAAGDVLTIEFAPVGGDGAAVEKQRTKNYPVQLGAGQIFPSFEEALTGKKAGETGRVDVAYPADYESKRVAGRTVTYEFAVNEVRERRLPELDDALVARIDERFATVSALRDDIRSRLAAEKEKEARRRREERAVDLIIERNPFDVPNSMRERFKKELYAEDEQRGKAAGVGPEEDEERRAQMESFFSRVAERNIKRYFVMDYIADKERIEVSDGEIDAELAAIASESGRPVDDLKKYLAQDRDRLAGLRARLRERKLFSIILGDS